MFGKFFEIKNILIRIFFFGKIELLVNEIKQKNLNFTILLEIIVPECDRNLNYTKFVHNKISEKNLTEHVKIVYHSFGINDDIVNEKLLKSHLFWHTAYSEVFLQH